ncbi:MAG: hypothetical protein I8H91_14590 [Burkholderiales bacterium]|nr:hypothetical protein [Burkholderiales bacterium]
MCPATAPAGQPGDVPNDLNALYDTQRASAGLIVTEATQISRRAGGPELSAAFRAQLRAAFNGVLIFCGGGAHGYTDYPTLDLQPA